MEKISDVVDEVIGETMEVIHEGESVVEEAVEEVEDIIVENEFGSGEDKEGYDYALDDMVEYDDTAEVFAGHPGITPSDDTVAFNFTDDYVVGAGGAQSDDIFSLSTILSKVEGEAQMVEGKVQEEIDALGVKVSATIGGCAILLMLLLVVLTRRGRYRGRRPVREVRDIELQRNNFDDWQYPDDKNRFVID